MGFITIYIFKAYLTKPALMDFIANVHPDQYFFLISSSEVYGIIVSDDLMEYFTTEFKVHGLEHVGADRLRVAMRTQQCRTCGNNELLDFNI